MNGGLKLNLTTISDLSIINLIESFEQDLIQAYMDLASRAQMEEEDYNDILKNIFGFSSKNYAYNLREALNMTSQFTGNNTKTDLVQIGVSHDADSYSAEFRVTLDSPIATIKNSATYAELENYLMKKYQEKLYNLEININSERYADLNEEDNPLIKVEAMWDDLDDISESWAAEMRNDNKVLGWLSEIRGLHINNSLVSVNNPNYDYDFFGIPLDNKTNTKSFHYTTRNKLSFNDYPGVFKELLIDIFTKTYNYNGGFLNQAEIETMNSLLNAYAKLIAISSKAIDSKYATIVSNATDTWYTQAVSSILNTPNRITNSGGFYNYVTETTTPDAFQALLDKTIGRWDLSYK